MARRRDTTFSVGFVDTFCGAIEQLPKGQRTVLYGLRALKRNPRVSTFERGPYWLESLLAELQRDGLVTEDKDEPYPWHRFILTDKARAMLQEAG